jgi:hypothetical protein
MESAMRVTVLASLLVAAPLAVFAQSGDHGVGHAENHEWYKKLLHPNSGASCCDNRDCRPTRAYVDDDGAWQAQLDGRWVEVPKDAVLRTRAPDGNSHICANEAGIILCFIGGEPKS